MTAKFLSTPSARRATPWQCAKTRYRTIFLSTPSARRATRDDPRRVQGYCISIHALREEGDRVSWWKLLSVGISIHALREEGDNGFLDVFARRVGISIHALREEGDPASRTAFWLPSAFLSTPSARRATIFVAPRKWLHSISIHALREEGDYDIKLKRIYIEKISIHALREEGDRGGSSYRSSESYFYPRPPRGGRPLSWWMMRLSSIISIHALREEGDCSPSDGTPVKLNFYPRPPRGGRPAESDCNSST